MVKLSILVPSLSTRTEYLHRLLSLLNPQVSSEIEILIDIDNGTRTIGDKRNALLKRATGRYVSFVDDDDRVSPDYVQQMMAGIEKGVDAVCIQGVFNQDGCDQGIFIDKPFTTWSTEIVDGVNIYHRGVQHLDAVRREIAQ